MTWNTFFLRAVVVGAAAIGASAVAAPITFIHRGQFEGLLGDETIPLSSFTLTAHADTDDALPGLLYHSSPATLEIEGQGTFVFQFQTFSWITSVSFDNWVVGIARIWPDPLDVYAGPVDSALRHWTMTTSIGPLSGVGHWSNVNVPMLTDRGYLVVLPGNHSTTFTAIVVPEPATASPLVFAAFAIAGAIRRR